MVDLHTHILPGIDDGAQTSETANMLLCEEEKQGVESLIFTPHFNIENMTIEKFLYNREFSYELIKTSSPNITKLLGAEVYYSPMLTEIDISPLCFAGSRYILIEFPSSHIPYLADETVLKLCLQGYRPILAHIERYPFITSNTDLLLEWIAAGCLTQINASSLLKHSTYRSVAYEMINNNLAHIIASDTHSLISRAPNLTEAYSQIRWRCGFMTEKRMKQNSQDIFDSLANIR